MATKRQGEVPLTALLRASRGAYGQAIGRELASGGFDDLPRSAPFILGGMGNRGGKAADLIRQLNISKQAASQLIDTLVLRGYLVRQEDPEDGRRVSIELTPRGRAAATAVRAGVDAVDVELGKMISESELAAMRQGLIALCNIRDRYEAHDRRHESVD